MAKKRDKLRINVKRSLFTYSQIDPDCRPQELLKQLETNLVLNGKSLKTLETRFVKPFKRFLFYKRVETPTKHSPHYKDTRSNSDHHQVAKCFNLLGHNLATCIAI